MPVYRYHLPVLPHRHTGSWYQMPAVLHRMPQSSHPSYMLQYHYSVKQHLPPAWWLRRLTAVPKTGCRHQSAYNRKLLHACRCPVGKVLTADRTCSWTTGKARTALPLHQLQSCQHPLPAVHRRMPYHLRSADWFQTWSEYPNRLPSPSMQPFHYRSAKHRTFQPVHAKKIPRSVHRMQWIPMPHWHC